PLPSKINRSEHESSFACRPIGAPSYSEHAVLIRRLRGNVLDYIPMLDDLAVLDAENIDDRAPRPVVAARRVHVQHHEIAFGDYTFDLTALIGKALFQEIDEG